LGWLKITVSGNSRIENLRSREAALHLDPVSPRRELATASVNFQDCKDSMDSAIDPQLPAVEQTNAAKFLVKRQGREISVHQAELPGIC
jgi:hypothetical protein